MENKSRMKTNTLRAKSLTHKVKYLGGTKRHCYDVFSESGEKYDVGIVFTCDCRYFSVQGAPNGKVCSHILAAIRKIMFEGNILKNEEIK